MVRAYITPLLMTALFAVGGCGVSPLPPGDVDGGADMDGPQGQPDAQVTPTTGLLFSFRSYPTPLPSDPDGDFEIVITDARMTLRNVRAVGDAAPGDERTTLESVVLQYDTDGEPGEGSLQFAMPNAPPGVYSLLIAEVIHYEIRGTVNLSDGEATEYRIEDEFSSGHTINVDLKGQILESSLLTVPIKSDLRKLPREVDWATAVVDDGEVEIDGDDSSLESVADKLDEVHRLDD